MKEQMKKLFKNLTLGACAAGMTLAAAAFIAPMTASAAEVGPEKVAIGSLSAGSGSFSISGGGPGVGNAWKLQEIDVQSASMSQTGATAHATVKIVGNNLTNSFTIAAVSNAALGAGGVYITPSTTNVFLFPGDTVTITAGTNLGFYKVIATKYSF